MKVNRLLFVLFFYLCCISTVVAQTSSLKNNIEVFIASKQATVGVSVCKIDGTNTLSVHGGDYFPMQSVFKFHVALAVLNEVDKGTLALDQKIEIDKSDLLPDTWSPIRDKYPDGVSLSVAEIIVYTVAQSDNNGCDILWELIGGAESIEKYFAEIGAKELTIKMNEQQMQTNWENQFLNRTTPQSAVTLLSDFYNGNILSPQSTAFLHDVMVNTATGGKRLKGLLPQGVTVAHKTGTSGTNDQGVTAAVNDIGIVTLPDGSAYMIAVFVSNSKENNETNEAIIAEVSKQVYDFFMKNLCDLFC